MVRPVVPGAAGRSSSEASVVLEAYDDAGVDMKLGDGVSSSLHIHLSVRHIFTNDEWLGGDLGCGTLHFGCSGNFPRRKSRHRSSGNAWYAMVSSSKEKGRCH